MAAEAALPLFMFYTAQAAVLLPAFFLQEKEHCWTPWTEKQAEAACGGQAAAKSNWTGFAGAEGSA